VAATFPTFAISVDVFATSCGILADIDAAVFTRSSRIFISMDLLGVA